MDFSGLRTDLHGRSLDPSTDVGILVLVGLSGLDPDEVAATLATESLLSRNLQYIFEVPTKGRTSLSLSELSFSNTPLDPEEHLRAEAGPFLLAVTADPAEGGEFLMMALLDLGAEGAGTSVDLALADSSLSV